MRFLAASTASFLLASSLAAGQDASAVPSPGLGAAKDWKILYAGSPDGFREKAWVEFLREHFATVDARSLAGISPADAAPYDVVIADWTSRYGNDGYPKDFAGPETALGSGWTKPTILIGAVGGEIARHSLIDWL